MSNKEDAPYTQIDPNIFKCEDTVTYDVSYPYNGMPFEEASKRFCEAVEYAIKEDESYKPCDNENKDVTSEDNGTCYYKFTINTNKYVDDKKSIKPKQPWYINQINKNHNRKKR